MSQRLNGQLHALRAAVVPVAVVGALGFFGTMAATSSETLLRSSFSTALNNTVINQVVAAKSAPISGSEDFWLSAMRQDGRSSITKAVSIGDQISLSLGGERRTLEVAAVSEFTPQITEIDTSSSHSRLVLVTARDTSNSARQPIRFVMEIEKPSAADGQGRGARAL